MSNMSNRRPLRFIITGGVLLVAGWILPLLMTLRILPLSYALAFLSYVMSVGGLAAGVFGVMMYIRSR